jgi:hypothetical protein
VNAAATNHGVTLFLDNVDMMKESKFAPRVVMKESVQVGGKKLDVTGSFIMKGNTATKRTASTKDVFKLAVKVGAYSRPLFGST